MKSGFILGGLLAISAWLWADSSSAVDFESLLGELTSRDTLAIHPTGRNLYDLLQASSYDRRAVSPNDPGWFSNQDWAAPDRRNFLREEINEGRTEWVLMESQRPGAIVRFWGGGFPQNGTLRFYVDGAGQPVLSGIASELLGRDVTGFGGVLSSVTVHLDPSDPAYNRAGFNLYAPIPYSKSMKVTYQVAPNIGDKRPNFWYNINYREYDDGIQVGSFSSNAIRRAAPLLKMANSRLADPAVAPRGVGNVREARDALLKTGESLRFKYSGTGALKRLSIRIDPNAMGAALRDIQLSISFDGRETVRVPIGDFFATGPERLNDVQTYFFEVASDTGEMTAYWVMPFQHQVDVQLFNEGAETIDTQLECEIGDFQWSGHTMYFHANYRESIGVEVGREALAQDWSYVELEGKGLYVGDSLSINNTAASWWGEGDEKIYVDGASFPTHFGTGSEDYYGYAWGRDFIFNQPFISQPQGDGNEPSFSNPPGLTVNTRVRVLDAIPFNSSLKVDMELWHQNAGARVDLRVAVFWYGFQGTTDLLQ